MQKNRRLWIIAAYLFTAVYLLPMFPHGGSANELIRWATAASLIEKGSFEISWTEQLIGPNVDTAKIGDRVYSNKAPGTAILAAPVYALTRLFVGPPNASNIRISWFAMRFALSTLPLLILAIWLYRKGADEFALVTLLFATPLFLYSLLFFSHVFVAVAVYFAFRLMYDNDGGRPKDCLWTGMLSGLAVISEFPAVFVVAVFGVGLLFTNKAERYSRLLFYVLGGLPFLIFLLIYNNALFGSPFSMSYAHESFPEWAEVSGQGVFGIGFPSLTNAYLLLLSPSRGLFFSSPILILSVIVFIKSFDRRDLRRTIRLAVVVLSITLICGHGAAHGGWAFGPRYLIFVIPILLDPFFNGEIRGISSLWLGLLFGASLLLCLIPALTFPFAPPEFEFPHNDFWMSLMREESWFVPNLANVLGFASSVWTLLPIFFCLAALVYFVLVSMREPKKFLVGFGVAALAVGIYVFLPGIGGGEDKVFRRTTIAERYFKPADRLEKYVAEASSRNDWTSVQKINDFRWTIADARAFAPDDFPYLEDRQLSPSPTTMMKAALQYQKQGNMAEAERTLALGNEQFPFARCEFATNLAVVFFLTNRKDAALSELESIQPLVDAGSRPDCLRSQFLLGSLYREIGRVEDANAAFQRFLKNTSTTNDSEMRDFRNQLGAK